MPLPDVLERPLSWSAGMLDRLTRGRLIEVSEAAVAGGFLRLHLRGDRADAVFGLNHPPPIVSVYEALEDARRSGLAPWLRLVKPSIRIKPETADHSVSSSSVE